MAHATPNTRFEKRMVETEVEVNDGVVLMLTDDEALALAYLTGTIAGISEFRNLTSNIYDALQRAGVDSMPMHRHNKRNGNGLLIEAKHIEIVRA